MLTLATCNVLGNIPCGHEGVTLQFNDGTGWKPIYGPVNAYVMHLTGFDGGAAVLTSGDCGITLVDPSNGHVTCTSVLPNLTGGVFVASDKNAYAWDGANLDHFDGEGWSPFATLPVEIAGLWADDHIAVAVGFKQAIYLKPDGSSTFQLLPNVPAGDYGAVWAFGANDIWAGSQAGLLVHYDGSTWRSVDPGSLDGTGDGVNQLWANAGTLFFRTNSEFGRWNGTAAELLLTKNDRISIASMWGNSPSEVFLTLSDSKYGNFSCYGLYAVVYDGQSFHQF